MCYLWYFWINIRTHAPTHTSSNKFDLKKAFLFELEDLNSTEIGVQCVQLNHVISQSHLSVCVRANAEEGWNLICDVYSRYWLRNWIIDSDPKFTNMPSLPTHSAIDHHDASEGWDRDEDEKKYEMGRR